MEQNQNQPVEKPENPVVKFVKKHRVAIAVTVTSAAWLALNQAVVRQHNDFLKEHGLYDEFYSDPTDYSQEPV